MHDASTLQPMKTPVITSLVKYAAKDGEQGAVEHAVIYDAESSVN